MKTKIIFLITLFSINSFASDIRGLDSDEVKDLDYCSKRLKRISAKKLNSLPNYSENLWYGEDLNYILMHNFIYDMNSFEAYEIDNSAIVSATLRYSKFGKITNSIVSNMTFVGDVSKLDFTGSCLVNVRFPVETSWSVKRKIRKQALYYKNLEYKDELDPWD